MRMVHFWRPFLRGKLKEPSLHQQRKQELMRSPSFLSPFLLIFQKRKSPPFFKHQNFCLFSRLFERMEKAKEEGWTNVTDLPLVPRIEFSDVTQLNNPARRSGVTLLSIFKRILSGRFVEVLVSGVKAKEVLKREGKRGPGLNFHEDDVFGLVAMILDICGRQVHQFRDYVRDPERRVGLSANRYEDLKAHLDFNMEDLISAFNDSLKESIVVGGHGVVDESMLPWHGKSPFSITIPRKPKSTGLRMYVVCFPLASTGQPVAFHVIPDIRSPTYGGREVLDIVYDQLPADRILSITADSFFGNLNWMTTHQDRFLTLAIPKNSDPKLFELFSKDLAHHEFRSFAKGDLVVTLWLDESLVITASTRYKTKRPGESSREGSYRGIDFNSQREKLSLPTIHILEKLPQDQLEILAKKCGISTSGSRSDLAFRIGGRLPPRVTSGDPGPSTEIGNSAENPPSENPLKERATELQKNSKTSELKEICGDLGLSKSNQNQHAQKKNSKETKEMTKNSSIGGNKFDLAMRIVRFREKGGGSDAQEAEIQAFLRPSRTSTRRPTLINDYFLSFNGVDRLNKLRSYFEFHPRINSEKFLILIHVIRMSFIQSWSLFTSWNGNEENEERNLRDAARSLAEELHPRFA